MPPGELSHTQHVLTINYDVGLVSRPRYDEVCNISGRMHAVSARVYEGSELVLYGTLTSL